MCTAHEIYIQAFVSKCLKVLIKLAVDQINQWWFLWVPLIYDKLCHPIGGLKSALTHSPSYSYMTLNCFRFSVINSSTNRLVCFYESRNVLLYNLTRMIFLDWWQMSQWHCLFALFLNCIHIIMLICLTRYYFAGQLSCLRVCMHV